MHTVHGHKLNFFYFLEAELSLIELTHLDLLGFFKAFQLAKAHILRLDPPSPLQQAAGEHEGGRLRSWGWWGSTGARGWSRCSCFLHDSLKRQRYYVANQYTAYWGTPCIETTELGCQLKPLDPKKVFKRCKGTFPVIFLQGFTKCLWDSIVSI